MNDKFDFPPFGPTEQQPNGPVPAPPELPARKRRGGRRAAPAKQAKAKPAAGKRRGRPPRIPDLPPAVVKPAAAINELEAALHALEVLRVLPPSTRRRIFKVFE